MKIQTYREYLNSKAEKNPIYLNHKEIYEAYQERIAAQKSKKYIRNITEKALKDAIVEVLKSK